MLEIHILKLFESKQSLDVAVFIMFKYNFDAQGNGKFRRDVLMTRRYKIIFCS